jgi:hypothetical protein
MNGVLNQETEIPKIARPNRLYFVDEGNTGRFRFFVSDSKARLKEIDAIDNTSFMFQINKILNIVSHIVSGETVKSDTFVIQANTNLFTELTGYETLAVFRGGLVETRYTQNPDGSLIFPEGIYAGEEIKFIYKPL